MRPRAKAADVRPDMPGSTLDYELLQILLHAARPVGSSYVQHELGARGRSISEPTVGRLLRATDKRGLTIRVSNVGRVLTETGRAHLDELRYRTERGYFQRNLLHAMEPSSLQQLWDVLVARRALERETARLAAINANARDVADLKQSLRATQDEGVAPVLHEIVARMSGNKVLAAALALISNDQRLRNRLRAILREDQLLVDDSFNHQIVEAIEQHDPDRAEGLMAAHLGAILESVRRFAERKRSYADPFLEPEDANGGPRPAARAKA